MSRPLAALLLAALSTAALARQPADPPVPNPTVFKLTTTPAAAPVPALRYEFRPRASERTAGNAAADYFRAALTVPQWPRPADPNEPPHAVHDRWADSPLDAFPDAEVTAHLDKFAVGFEALDAGALRETCDWRQGVPVRLDRLEDHLNEFGKFREIMVYNRMRVRRDLARKDFDAAARDIRSGFRFAKAVGEGPTVVQMLVGHALALIACGDAGQFIGRPGSPNLYWALAGLPHPLIDPRVALDNEAALTSLHLPDFPDLDKGPIDPARADRVAADFFAAITKLYQSEPVAAADVPARVAKAAPAARNRLVALGRPAADVEKLPAAQAVVLNTILTWRVSWDDQVKAFALPYPRAWAEFDRLGKQAAEWEKDTDPLLAVSPPRQVLKLYNAHARVGRTLDALQAVEAVRLHAAANAGRPPARLADITAVSVPPDPFTGRPFEYTATAAGFTLTAPPPAGETANLGNSFRYEVSFLR
ncbi:hypothetical protein J0H58_16150 [bacterium]|nr:hypothetical protein [bacterium]